MRQTVLILFVVLTLCLTGPAEATHWNSFYKLCLEEVEIPPLRVPVGCEIIDCCPWCPGPPEILDWRILVERGLTRSVEVTFERADERAMARLQFRGNVKRQGNTLLIGPGESFISGLPNARKGGRVTVGAVKIVPDAEQIRSLNAA